MADPTENKLVTDVAKVETPAHDLPTRLPILPLSDVVVFPHMVAPLLVSNRQSIQLIDDVVAGNRLLAVTMQTDPDLEQPRPDQLRPYGCVARVMRMLKFPDDSVRVLIQGLKRMRIVHVESEKPYLQAEIAPLDDELDPTLETPALARNAGNLFQEIINLSPSLPDELKVAVVNIEDPSKLADVIAANLNIPLPEKQRLLEAVSVKTRLTQLTSLLNHEVEVLHLGSEIQSKVNTALSKSQRDYFLREQLKAIQKELGESGENSEIGELRDKIDKAQMPPEVKKVAIKEADRLATITPAAAEYAMARSYLDWLIAMPWSKGTDDKLDIAQARRILDEDHYDLENVKKRILEYLSVLKLKSNGTHEAPAGKGPILCFVGPPGVGKTSLGMSIARALGRKFIRISLGGVRDEAEIRGHRRT